MQIERISLGVKLGNFLELKEPFWVASCHFTEKESAIGAWEEIGPAALTLKTSKKTEVREDKERIHERLLPISAAFGKSTYCDGPKHEEFLSYRDTSRLLDYAKSKLGSTKIGASVLADKDEDYSLLRQTCVNADFYELNLKYAFRIQKAYNQREYLLRQREVFSAVLDEVSRFCIEMSKVPIFVKLSRELDWLPGTPEQTQLLDRLQRHGRCGVVLANSLKADLPEVVHDGRTYRFRGGVVCGEHLFSSTVSLVEGFYQPCRERNIPIVASGGMVDEEHILHAFLAGASSVQLCTTFDYHRVTFYNALRTALKARIFQQGLDSFEQYHDRLPQAGVASIYNVPFFYFDRFWSDTVQNHILSDIKRSQTMIVAVMSGYTLSKKWEEELKARFRRNLGISVFLPNPDGDLFCSIHRSWGVKDGTEMDALKLRVREAERRFRALWDQTSEERKKAIPQDEKEEQLIILYHDQCPFFSFYVFDENVYLSPYPLLRTEEVDSPVFVFFAISKEYSRAIAELDRLRAKVLQTQLPKP